MLSTRQLNERQLNALVALGAGTGRPTPALLRKGYVTSDGELTESGLARLSLLDGGDNADLNTMRTTDLARAEARCVATWRSATYDYPTVEQRRNAQAAGQRAAIRREAIRLVRAREN